MLFITVLLTNLRIMPALCSMLLHTYYAQTYASQGLYKRVVLIVVITVKTSILYSPHCSTVHLIINICHLFPLQLLLVMLV